MNLANLFLLLSALSCTQLNADYTQRTISYSYSTTEISTKDETSEKAGYDTPDNFFSDSDDAQERWEPVALFSAYWHYKDTAVMINNLHTKTGAFVQKIFDAFESATKDQEVSLEEKSKICARLFIEMLGLKSIEDALMQRMENNDENITVDDEITIPVSLIASAELGKEFLEITDLYHILMMRLAIAEAVNSDLAIEEIFQLLELSLLTTITTKHPQISSQAPLEETKAYLLGIVETANEFLTKKLEDTNVEVLSVADLIAGLSARDSNSLTFLDFKRWTDLQSQYEGWEQANIEAEREYVASALGQGE